MTGAGRGLGGHIAAGLAKKGLSVLCTDIDAAAAEETAAQIGNGAWATYQDVRDPGSHREIARDASSRGQLAVWVNNAGVLRTATAWEQPEEEVRMQVEVNLLGLVWGSRAAVDAMRDRGGHIINVVSLSALVPSPGLAAYGASKRAALGYTLSLEGELREAKLPIHVSAVCPDAIDTPMVRDEQHKQSSAILFSARELLDPHAIAARVVELVDRPQLLVVEPKLRGALAYLFAPFPKIQLLALEQYRRVGDRHRRGK